MKHKVLSVTAPLPDLRIIFVEKKDEDLGLVPVSDPYRYMDLT